MTTKKSKQKMKIYKLNSIESDIRKEGKPVLPRKDQYSDPTKQGSNRAKAISDINKRYGKAKIDIEAEIRKFFNETNRELIRTNANTYDYKTSNEQISTLTKIISVLLFRNIGLNMSLAEDPSFFLSKYVSKAYLDGTKDLVQSAKNISTADNIGEIRSSAVRGINVDNLLVDRNYIARKTLTSGKIFDSMKSTVQKTASDIIFELKDGINKGNSVTSIIKNVSKRISVGKSKAKNSIRTEINDAYREAISKEMNTLNDDFFSDDNFEMRMLWFSALSPTTRPNHASRHGKTYTTGEVKDFYSKDGNKYNCLCSQTAVLVNKKTGRLVQQSLVKGMKKQKKEWAEDN